MRIYGLHFPDLSQAKEKEEKGKNSRWSGQDLTPKLNAMIYTCIVK